MFSATNAYQHARCLSFPRLAGSRGESQAASYLVDALQQVEAKPRVQSFTFSSVPERMTRYLPLVCALGLLTVSFSVDQPSLPMVLLLCGLLGASLVLARWHRWYGKLYDIGAQTESANIITEIPPAGELQRRIVFMAHYDSKSQFLPIAVRSICYAGLVLAAVLLLCWHVVGSWFPPPLWFKPTYLGDLAALCGAMLFFNRTGNASPGAADNAASVGILMELVRTFEGAPLEHVHLTFLFTGAEEMGMAGAVRYMQQNSPIDEHAQFINLDGVAADTAVGIVRGAGSSVHTLNLELRQTAHQLGTEVVSVPNWTGVGSDHLPIGAHGYGSVMLCSRSLPMALHIHSSRDTFDQVSLSMVERVGKLCEAIVRRCDQQI